MIYNKDCHYFFKFFPRLKKTEEQLLHINLTMLFQHTDIAVILIY